VDAYSYQERDEGGAFDGYLQTGTTGKVVTYGLDTNGDGDTYDTYQNYNIQSYTSSADGGTTNQQRVGFLFRIRAEDYNNSYSGRILIENLSITPNSDPTYCITSGTNVPFFKFKSGSLSPAADNGGGGTQSNPFEFELEATGDGGQSDWVYVLVGLQYASPAGTSAGSSIRAKVENTSGYTNLPSDSSYIDIQQGHGENLTFYTNQQITRGDQGPAAADYFNAYLANSVNGTVTRQLIRIRFTNPSGAGSSSTTYRATIKLALISNSTAYT
jgi:hypothetical protein